MPKWDVEVTWKGTITVDADSEEEAVTRAGEEATAELLDEFDGQVLEGPYDESDEQPEGEEEE